MLKLSGKRTKIFLAIFSIAFLLLFFKSKFPIHADSVDTNNTETTYLVKLKDPDIRTVDIKLNPEKLPYESKDKSKDIDNWIIVTVKSDTDIQDLKNNGNVAVIDKEKFFQIMVTPNDPYYSSSGAYQPGLFDQWDMRAMKLLPVNPLDNPATSGWQIGTGANQTIVAVIDTGIDLTHTDLINNIWTNTAENSGVDGVDDDGNGFIDDKHGWNFANNNGSVQDLFGHGTHVSGTIAAVANNSTGIAGVCWTCKIMPVNVFGNSPSASDVNIASGITYAVDNGAKVINMSLGGSGYSQIMQDAVDYAWSQGVLVVVAAGNQADDASFYSPSSLNHVITVGATGTNNGIAGFSNFGNRLDLMAPGTGIVSTRLTGIPDNGICTVTANYICLNGTSMSSPHIAGLAALLYDLHRTDSTPWNMKQVRYVLLNTAQDLGNAGFDTLYGYGLGDALAAMKASTPSLGNTTPTVQLDTPSNIYFNDPVVLTGSVNATNLYMYNIKLEDNTNAGIYNYTGRSNVNSSVLMSSTLGLPDGTYHASLRAEDFNGNETTTAKITFIEDSTAPLAFALSAPANNGWNTNNKPPFIWSASSDANPFKYNLYLDNSIYVADLSTLSYTPTVAIADGTHTWNVIAKDGAGNTTQTSTFTVKIDSVNPSVNANSNVTNNSATITFSGSDATSGIANYQVKLGTGSYITATSPYIYNSLIDGAYTVTVKATDNAGNINTATTNFTIRYRRSKGDFNNDGVVNLSDLSILASFWNTTNQTADANNDGHANLSDLSILASDWLQHY